MNCMARLLTHIISRNIHNIDGMVKFITDESVRHSVIAASEQEVSHILTLVRSAPDNPYTTDEEIACEIMRRVYMKKHKG